MGLSFAGDLFFFPLASGVSLGVAEASESSAGVFLFLAADFEESLGDFFSFALA